MKYRFLSLALVALAACACNSYTIKGDVEGLEGTVYMWTKGEVVDSAQVSDGQFSFKGNGSTPQLMTITDNTNDRLVRFYCRCYAEPGTITIASVDGGYAASGTVSNDAEKDFAEKMQTIETEEEYVAVLTEALEQNKDNIFGVFVLMNLSYGEMDAAEVAERLKEFPKNIRNSNLYKAVAEANEKALATAAGQDYIDFTQPLADGDSLSLSEVVGNPANKYVLLDFWASWCSPCMGEVPYLVKAYDEYHYLGFEILGVSFDADAAAWQGAIDANRMEWLHVSDLKAWDNAAGALYGIRSIPANFLIDCTSGKIIGSGLRGEALKEKLAELLAQPVL